MLYAIFAPRACGSDLRLKTRKIPWVESSKFARNGNKADTTMRPAHVHYTFCVTLCSHCVGDFFHVRGRDFVIRCKKVQHLYRAASRIFRLNSAVRHRLGLRSA